MDKSFGELVEWGDYRLNISGKRSHYIFILEFIIKIFFQFNRDDSITRFVASVHLGVPHSYVSCHVSRKLDEKKVRVRALIR